MVPMREFEIVEASHEPFPGSAVDGVRAPVCCRIRVRGRADLPVGLDAQQRVPTSFMVPMRAKFLGGGFPCTGFPVRRLARAPLS